MSSDPEAGFRFYSGLFGWQKSQAVDMGAMGTYQVFSHDGDRHRRHDGPRQLAGAGLAALLRHRTASTRRSARIEAAGGKLAHGPMEVPGGAFIAVAQDPQGAWFAVVGPKEALSRHQTIVAMTTSEADQRGADRRCPASPSTVTMVTTRTARKTAAARIGGIARVKAAPPRQ